MENLITSIHLEFSVSPEKAWQGLTDPTIVKEYFFRTELSGEWKVGETIYYRGTYKGTPYEDKGIITRLECPHLLEYDYRTSWDELPDERENYLRVTYTIESTPTGSRLSIEQVQRSPEKAKESEEGWKYVLSEMKKLIEA